MLRVLANRTYRHLFAAQIIALLGTGLATVALGLLAWDLAGNDAGRVLGTALAIKMIAYVALAPVAAALAERLPRRALLVSLDLIRAAVALALPFVTTVGQVYGLIFLLQAASAGFTPAFQATIPEVLPEERDYTRALSLSRLAYDLESLISPMLAAALLSVVSFPMLFGGTVAGFAASAGLIVTVRLPAPAPERVADRGASFGARLTRGIRLYLAAPRLRGVLALNLAVAAAGAMVIVNTVVLVQARLGLGAPEVALALAAFGAGSMAAALALPRLLERVADRPAMLAGAALLVAGMALGPLVGSLAALAPLWALIGLGYSLVQTPVGRLLRRSARPAERPALFAAQFALSHAAWLLTYPMAGWVGAGAGLDAAFIVMALIGAAGGLAALLLWPAAGAGDRLHGHPDLPADHPHLRDAGPAPHRHAPMGDALHRA